MNAKMVAKVILISFIFCVIVFALDLGVRRLILDYTIGYSKLMMETCISLDHLNAQTCLMNYIDARNERASIGLNSYAIACALLVCLIIAELVRALFFKKD